MSHYKTIGIIIHLKKLKDNIFCITAMYQIKENSLYVEVGGMAYFFR